MILFVIVKFSLNYFHIQNGKQTIKNRWILIKDSLCKLITNSRDLEKAIKSYNSGIPTLEALHYFFEEVSLIQVFQKNVYSPNNLLDL